MKETNSAEKRMQGDSSSMVLHWTREDSFSSLVLHWPLQISLSPIEHVL